MARRYAAAPAPRVVAAQPVVPDGVVDALAQRLPVRPPQAVPPPPDGVGDVPRRRLGPRRLPVRDPAAGQAPVDVAGGQAQPRAARPRPQRLAMVDVDVAQRPLQPALPVPLQQVRPPDAVVVDDVLELARVVGGAPPQPRHRAPREPGQVDVVVARAPQAHAPLHALRRRALAVAAPAGG